MQTQKLSRIPIVPDVPSISENQDSDRSNLFAIDSDQIFLSF